MSQRDLAAKLEVHESEVSRDERNEYHGITVDRAIKISLNDSLSAAPIECAGLWLGNRM